MAPVNSVSLKYLFGLIILLTYFSISNGQCDINIEFQGSWYSMEDGKDVYTSVSPEKWGELECLEKKRHLLENTNVEGVNVTMLMQRKETDESTTNKCFVCVDVLWRTPNVLNYRKSSCFSIRSNFRSMCSGYDNIPTQDQLLTMFRNDRLEAVNCISTWEGVYQFTYEVNFGGGGICDNPNSILRSCLEPGSPYIDNRVFTMSYEACPSVQTSKKETIRYECLGSWYAVLGKSDTSPGIGYTFAAIADTVEQDTREKYKCLLTNKNQKQEDNSIRWTMSRFADCSKLNSIYEGPVRLRLFRANPPTKFQSPQCNLPRNISGTWYTQGIQFKSDVFINDTHIRYKTLKNQFEFEETFLSCQQTLGTRYLMTKYVKGKCEVDFVCFDILPRHHGLVRYRVGKPSRLTADEEADPKFMTKKFREVCSWQSFTYNRDDTDWKYEVLILNPPSPVSCPIAGRYRFAEQNAQDSWELYSTRIRTGVTERPRMQVNCRVVVSEFKSCSQDRSRIEIDQEYCESVDYRGRPIGEYDEPDRVLTCVGFWMEDMKSYLITYDEEDAISKFRCWVYERISWTSISLSRSQTARCARGQTSRSYLLERTGLNLVLEESERLFDDCPQRFDPGIDPYTKPTVIYVLSRSSRLEAVSVSSICVFVVYLVFGFSHL